MSNKGGKNHRGKSQGKKKPPPRGKSKGENGNNKGREMKFSLTNHKKCHTYAMVLDKAYDDFQGNYTDGAVLVKSLKELKPFDWNTVRPKLQVSLLDKKDPESEVENKSFEMEHRDNLKKWNIKKETYN